jgi:inhibitor of cysteine peptidase
MKFKNLLITLCAFLLLSACSSVASIQSSCDEFQHNPNQVKDIEVSVGKEIKLTLCSNPTTGYQWSDQSQISDPAVIQQTSHQFEGPAIVGDPPAGAAGEEVWTFKATSAGSSSVILVYGQPWEGGERAAWTYTLNVSVVNK